MTHSPASQTVLFTAVKNEAPFLLEWLAYHRSIGFEKIIVASNDSDDGTTELLDALAAEGLIHHIYHTLSSRESPQAKAATAVNAAGLIQEGDWVLWLDADEFLNIHAGAGHLADLLSALGQARAVLIPWRLFGDSHNPVFPGRFISTNFTRASAADFPENQVVKMFYRHVEGGTRLSLIAGHRPKLLRKYAISAQHIVTAGGQPIDLQHHYDRRWLRGWENRHNCFLTKENFDYALVQINHYLVRTRDMYDLKAYRGRGFRAIAPGAEAPKPRHTPDFFVKQNRNEAEDRSILRHEQATSRELAALLAHPEIAATHAEGVRRTAVRIAEMTQDEPLAAAAAPRQEPSQEAPNVLAETAPAAQPPSAEPAAPSLHVPTFTMPDAEQALVAKYYASHDVLLEYGSGGSTLLAAGQPHSLIMSVESDQAWCSNMTAVLARDFPAANVRMHWVDIGPTGKWGRPVNDRAWKKFSAYPLSVWDQDWFRHPDLILIDGRFRVGCMLAALLRITRPVTVLFDDYLDRPPYIKAVERFVKPVETVGRMARFEIEPMPLPPARLTEIVALMSEPY